MGARASAAHRDPTRSPDGHFMVALTGGPTARLVSSKNGECVRVFEGHKDEVLSVSFAHVRTPHGGRIGHEPYISSPRCLPDFTPAATKLNQSSMLASSMNLSPSGLNASRKSLNVSRSEPFLRSIRPVSPAPLSSPRRIIGSPSGRINCRRRGKLPPLSQITAPSKIHSWNP